jgi:uncharacterized protein involved in tolerance to divalent cations
MILLHIITDDNDQAVEIADFLIKEKLMLSAAILENISGRRRTSDDEIQSIRQTLIIGKTKALLFNTIDEHLRKKYKEHMPIIYSLPIVNMDWEQANELIQGTTKV